MDKYFIKERIRYYRIKNNYTARNLSIELGMSSEYINQVETGRLNPSLDFLISFCDFFKIKLSDFFNDEEKYPDENKKILNELNSLSQNNIELVINLINALKDK